MSAYIRDLLERVGASFAGAVLATFGAGAVDVLHVDWPAALSVGAGAAIVSLLKALAARGVGDGSSASLAPGVELDRKS